MQAKDLRVGESCEFPSLSYCMRNGICLRQSHSGTYLSFEEKRFSDVPWKRVEEYISGSVDVRPIEKELVKVERNSTGELVMDGNAIEKKKRGRKAQEMEFPKSKFTIAELAEKIGCSTTNIYLKVQARIKKGTMQEFIEPRKKGQRGKPKKSYQVI